MIPYPVYIPSTPPFQQNTPTSRHNTPPSQHSTPIIQKSSKLEKFGWFCLGFLIGVIAAALGISNNQPRRELALIETFRKPKSLYS